ncbi:MAG: hypothetical protein MRZ79_05600 [Bacteroidia bacterium]|nr:hypothetical protein [Bacteroidia bacterium]
MSRAEKKAYQEFVDLLSDNPSSAKILRFRPSEEIEERVFDLIDKSKNEGLSESEKEELIGFRSLEHVVRMLKAKAREKLSLA